MKSMSIFSKGGGPHEKLSRFMAGGAVSMLSFIVGGLTGGLFWVVAMTRWLGPEKFGILGPIFNAFWLICTLLSFGIPQSLMTFVSHHYEQEKEESVGFAKEGNQMLLWIASFLFSVALVSLFLGVTGRVAQTTGALWFVVILGVSLNLLYWGTDAVLKGLQRLDLASLGQLLFPVGLFIGSAGGVVLCQMVYGKGTWLDVVGGATGMAAGALVAFLFCYFLLRRFYPEFFPLYRVKKRSRTWKIITFGSLSAACLTIFNLLVQMTPVLVGFFAQRGFFGATQEENLRVSGYFATANLYGQGAMMLMGLTFALLPAISEAHRANDLPLMQRYYHLSMKVALSLIIPLTFLYIFLGGRIVELFSGDQFKAEDISPYIGLIGIGFASLGLIFMLTNLYMGLKNLLPPFVALCLVLVAQPLGVLLSAVGFHDPKYAALTMAVVPFYAMLFMVIYLARRYRLRIAARDFWIPTGSCLAAAFFFSVFIGLKAPLPAAVVSGLVGYFLPGLFFGFLSQEDVCFLTSLFKEKPLPEPLVKLLKFSRGIRLWGQPIEF